jgi:hypothetical protein
MTPQNPRPHPVTDEVFDKLVGGVMATAPRFGHREHIHVTWHALRRDGATPAIDLVCDGIERTARDAGVPPCDPSHATGQNRLGSARSEPISLATWSR